MKCSCGEVMNKLTSHEIFVCFACMKGISVRRFEAFQHLNVKRRGANDWLVGSNPQTTVNLMRSQELEKLYEQWIAKRILE